MRSAGREGGACIGGRRCLAAVGLAAALAGGPLAASATSAGAVAAASAAPSTPASGIDPRPIEQAVERLRADPLLAGTEKTWHLEFKKPDKQPQAALPKRDPLLRWLQRLASVVSDTSRLLLYGLALVGVAVFAVTVRRFADLHRRAPRLASDAAATHVRGLDVRPESLPDDIGAAAWALWQAGDARGALSLLYRGALSRLIHRHEVPIATSSTEGECLALARGHLAPEAEAYLTRLVATWQAHVYGQHAVPEATGERLCREFGAGLDAPLRAVPTSPAPAGAAA